jgi:hypothetical protein
LDLEDFNLLVMKQARWICCLGYQPDVNFTVVSVLKLLEYFMELKLFADAEKLKS